MDLRTQEVKRRETEDVIGKLCSWVSLRQSNCIHVDLVLMHKNKTPHPERGILSHSAELETVQADTYLTEQKYQTQGP